MYLIVGLGNPGKEYENTRHNLGFIVIDELAKRLQISSFRAKNNSLVAQSNIGGIKVVLAKPQTFMNNSGQAVGSMVGWFKPKVKDLILIYDDVDLEVGQIRVRGEGSDGGHKGAKSVIASVKTSQFARIRIGIGRGDGRRETADYVLQKISAAQKDILAGAVVKAAEAVESIIVDGLAKAMNKYNN
ncbi:MAG: aminoacyl-tRNA hydrolase [bacterium]